MTSHIIYIICCMYDTVRVLHWNWNWKKIKFLHATCMSCMYECTHHHIAIHSTCMSCMSCMCTGMYIVCMYAYMWYTCVQLFPFFFWKIKSKPFILSLSTFNLSFSTCTVIQYCNLNTPKPGGLEILLLFASYLGVDFQNFWLCTMGGGCF